MPLNIATVAFYIIAVALVGSSLAVVLLRNIVHAALFLALSFGTAAGIYVLLNAEFIAIVQVLIYAGAVTVLVLFAIMLTQNAMSHTSTPFRARPGSLRSSPSRLPLASSSPSAAVRWRLAPQTLPPT